MARGGEVAIAAPSGPQERVEIRQISNGYVLTRSGQKDGKYYSHEEFTAGKPTLTATPAKPVRKQAGPKTPGQRARRRQY